jgi:hypothetical protein
MGTAHGIGQGAPKPETSDAKKSVQHAMVALKLQQPLMDAVQISVKDATGNRLVAFASMGPTASGKRVDYTPLAAQGFDTVLETSVTRFGFDSAGGKDPDVALFVVAHARRVNTTTGKELWSRDFAYLSRYAQLPTWAAQGQALVKSEYAHAYRALGERIVEETFLQTTTGRLDNKPLGALDAYGVCGIRPADPLLKTRGSPATPGQAEIVSDTVDSLQPTLRWEAFAFPPMRAAASPPTADSVDAVRYDLRVWKRFHCRRAGLRADRHCRHVPYPAATARAPSHVFLERAGPIRGHR